MRRAWAFVAAIILFGLMGWNLLTGQPILDTKVSAAGIVIIALTITWWFEAAEKHSR